MENPVFVSTLSGTEKRGIGVLYIFLFVLRDGWQYATDFPASYHSRQTFTDYVRRRRWSRRCRLETSGPWREIGSTKLLDISLQPWAEGSQVSAWAVATNGEVVVRHGVTWDCTEGTAWIHVASDILFQVRQQSGYVSSQHFFC
jgi:hypothetical protein